MASSRTFAAIYGLFLLLEIAVLILKHIEKKIDTLYNSSSLFRHANCFPHFFLFENKIILVLCPHLFLVNVILKKKITYDCVPSYIKSTFSS